MHEQNVQEYIVIGSGPAGVITAHRLLAAGHRVLMIDAGIKPDNESLAPTEDHFQNQLHPNNANFYAPTKKAKDSNNGNAQLTKARAHMLDHVDASLPVESNTFIPTQTLAQGGLSAAWGAACFTYTAEDLEKASLPDLKNDYEEIAQLIGISGPRESYFCSINSKQPAAALDHNASSIVNLFKKKSFPENLTIEGSSLAMLTEPHNQRRANPYYDMDFYSNFGDSVFRADVLLKNLKTNSAFTHIENYIALNFEESADQVMVECAQIKTNEKKIVLGKTVVITCGALNSYRLVANSMGIFEKPNPVLCNPYIYIPTLHLPFIGKKGAYFRHSLAQAFGEVLTRAGQKLTLQFYSYRSLLLSRLIIQTPMPVFFARLFWRSLVESLVIVGVHYPDDGKTKRSIFIKKPIEKNVLPTLCVHFPFNNKLGVARIFRKLIGLLCIPIGCVKTKMGGSIHYAGTIPFNRSDLPLSLKANGQLVGCKNVYVFDSSGWTYLPSRGLTFSIMAAAHNLTKQLIKEKST